MIATLIFCICTTALCAYTVYVLIQERQETENEIYKAMQEIDTMALKKPLKIFSPSATYNNNFNSSTLENKLSSKEKTTKEKKQIYKPKNIILNTYPISPTNELGIGYGFDARV
jgi:hypothetical protein